MDQEYREIADSDGKTTHGIDNAGLFLPCYKTVSMESFNDPKDLHKYPAKALVTYAKPTQR